MNVSEPSNDVIGSFINIDIIGYSPVMTCSSRGCFFQIVILLLFFFSTTTNVDRWKNGAIVFGV